MLLWIIVSAVAYGQGFRIPLEWFVLASAIVWAGDDVRSALGKLAEAHRAPVTIETKR